TSKQLTLADLADKMKAGETTQERYTNIRDTYNVLFDMYETMSGANLESEGVSNTAKIKENLNGNYELEVYPNSSWEEWNEFHHQELNERGEEIWVPGWDAKEGDPLTLEFATKSEAEAYYTKIRTMISTLEPVVGTFEPQESYKELSQQGWSYQNSEAVQVNLRVLNDNIGLMGENGIIDKDSQNYKLEVDYMYHNSFFQTEQWKQVSKEVIGETNLAIGKELFQVAIGNRVVKMRHTRRREEYKVKKKEHFENEETRIVGELKAYYKRLAQQKRSQAKYLKKVAIRIKKIKAAALKALKKSQARDAKRRKQSSKSKAKS
ncbi:hypothetical protein DID80_04680, partial [Candidatus Marinamargulisbacteria bacterium SCGC AAA071-K20]